MTILLIGLIIMVTLYSSLILWVLLNINNKLTIQVILLERLPPCKLDEWLDPRYHDTHKTDSSTAVIPKGFLYKEHSSNAG